MLLLVVLQDQFCGPICIQYVKLYHRDQLFEHQDANARHWRIMHWKMDDYLSCSDVPHVVLLTPSLAQEV
jgi:hypothetical protein